MAKGKQGAHPERMLVQIHGPDGRAIAPGQPVPAEWDREYVDSLVQDGAAAVIDDDEAGELSSRPRGETVVQAAAEAVKL